jgi:predicted dehydrogenase
MTTRKSTRRHFLKTAAATTAGLLAAPLFIPATALGRDEKRTAANDRIVIGVIGTGGRGRGLINDFAKNKEVQIVQVCDVDKKHLTDAQEQVNKLYDNKDCKATGDFREVIGNKDINAVIVATPDHWHALASIAAAKAGKDIYCEKPLTNSVGEGRALCKAVADMKVILQCGSMERSGENIRHVAELVKMGRIGKLQTVHISLPCTDPHHKAARELKDVPPAEMVPEGFDYDFWLGHTPKVPYTEKRCHFAGAKNPGWRFILTYGGGEMTDRGAHVIDLAQLCMGTDDTGPVDFEAKGVRNKDSLYNAFFDMEFTNVYANGVKMIGDFKEPRGLKLEGSDGWIFCHVHGQKLEASDAKILDGKGEKGVNPLPPHIRSFLDSVKSRKPASATAEIGHRTASICHINNIAMALGRKLKWDPKTEKFAKDDEANKMLTPMMREPWRL